jgi:hypothetical protein
MKNTSSKHTVWQEHRDAPKIEYPVLDLKELSIVPKIVIPKIQVRVKNQQEKNIR